MDEYETNEDGAVVIPVFVGEQQPEDVICSGSIRLPRLTMQSQPTNTTHNERETPDGE